MIFEWIIVLKSNVVRFGDVWYPYVLLTLWVPTFFFTFDYQGGEEKLPPFKKLKYSKKLLLNGTKTQSRVKNITIGHIWNKSFSKIFH